MGVTGRYDGERTPAAGPRDERETMTEVRHINDLQPGDKVRKPKTGRVVTVTKVDYPSPTGQRMNERGEWGPSYTDARIRVHHKGGDFWVMGDAHLRVHNPGPLPVGSRVFHDRRN